MKIFLFIFACIICYIIGLCSGIDIERSAANLEKEGEKQEEKDPLEELIAELKDSNIEIVET